LAVSLIKKSEYPSGGNIRWAALWHELNGEAKYADSDSQ
jgi:hypothetical protein